jgi:uroporphyrinogen III methyltransferase/synthase
MSNRSLEGRRVVVTRATSQASRLADRLVSLGATVVELPVIAIEEPVDGGAALGRAAERLSSGAYEWVACTSSNAASRLLSALGDRSVPPTVRWAAVGPGTAAVLADRGFPPQLVPTRSVSDELAIAFPTGSGRVLFPRAEIVRGALGEDLCAKGWEVDEVVAYRTVSLRPDPDQLAAARDADAIVFASSSAVERTVEALGRDTIPKIVVSIGPTTSGTARTLGLEVAIEAEEQSVEGLALAAAAAFDPPGKRRQSERAQQQQQQQ